MQRRITIAGRRTSLGSSNDDPNIRIITMKAAKRMSGILEKRRGKNLVVVTSRTKSLPMWINIPADKGKR